MMSPTYFAMRWAQLDEQIEAARLAGDIRGMQPFLAEQTFLVATMYGRARE
jgi:hypothetical protein